MERMNITGRNSEEERIVPNTEECTLSCELESMMLRSELGPPSRKERRRTPCSLPCDSMTEEELQAQNGPVQSWNLNGPMTPGRFHAMPEDLQDLYLKQLQKRIFGKETSQ